MKYLNSFNENTKFWAKSRDYDSKLENDLINILLEIKDLGYLFNINIKPDDKSYIRITNQYLGTSQYTFKEIDWEEIEDTISRLEDYLSLNGYTVNNVSNTGYKQNYIYIYFKK